jgi:hypothetical protein
MNAFSFGAVAREPSGAASDEAKPDKSLEAAWNVLEAANDLGDHVTVEACRRVIDASLNGTAPLEADLHVVVHYFR